MHSQLSHAAPNIAAVAHGRYRHPISVVAVVIDSSSLSAISALEVERAFQFALLDFPIHLTTCRPAVMPVDGFPKLDVFRFSNRFGRFHARQNNLTDLVVKHFLWTATFMTVGSDGCGFLGALSATTLAA